MPPNFKKVKDEKVPAKKGKGTAFVDVAPKTQTLVHEAIRRLLERYPYIKKS